jgi:electron transport complex protein RnfE
VLIVMCAIRELLGAGTLMGIQIMPAGYTPALMMVLPVGGFLTLGCLIAVMQWAMAKSAEKAEKKEKEGNK